MAFSTAAQSSTSRVSGPIWSRELAKATRPNRLTSPYVGLRPVMPHSDAGCRMLPPVSLPSAKNASPAATAAALPPLEPPGTRSRPQGLRVTWNAEFSVDDPIANSSMLPLPISTGPRSYSRSTTVALYSGTKFSRMREEHVVRIPLVDMTSLICMGMPVSGVTLPSPMLRSAAAAASRAASSVTVT